MVERKILVAAAIIVLISSVAGYSVGLFSASSGETITTTSSTTITQTETKTTTSTWNITETSTRTLYVPDYSKAIIRSHLVFDGTILVTYSIDKPTYSIGEIVHIKTTITNLTPNNRSFYFGGSMIEVRNSTKPVWVYPEGMYYAALGGLPGSEIDLSPGETKTLDQRMTADWNMTGLHYNREGIFYNNNFVPEGQYTVSWPTEIRYAASGFWHRESIEEEIPFTITKQD